MLKKKNDTLVHRVKEEREKIAGYEELAKLHTAYIAFLLDKLGATEDNAVLIKDTDVKAMLQGYEVRGLQADNGWNIYCQKLEA